MDMFNDINTSSAATITMLNDILMAEKMKAGQFNLDLVEEEVGAKMFFDVLHSFTLTAKSKDINLVYNNITEENAKKWVWYNDIIWYNMVRYDIIWYDMI